MNSIPGYRYFPWALGGGLCLLVAGRYLALSSNVADLGYFLANFANTVSEWPRVFYGHAQPLMLLWSAAYLTLPVDVAPLIVVGLQALTLLGSVWAIWLRFGLWPGAAMLLYYPLWANALFDFHFDHLAVPLLTVFYFACERRRFGVAVLAASSLVLVKEPFALQTVACGIYFLWLAFLLRGQGVSTRLVALAALLVLFGSAWFYAATHWLMPYFGDGGRGALDAGAFSWLGASLSEMLWTLSSQPALVLGEIVGTPGKLLYLAVVFGLLAFIPLLRPAALIVALPPLMIALLSRLDNYHGYANHYTAGVIVPAIVAFRDGLPVARRYWHVLTGRISAVLGQTEPAVRLTESRQALFGVVLLLWLVVGHWTLASSPISRLFWSDKVWSYSWRAYIPTERESMMKAAMLAYVPADRDASVSTQNTVNFGYLAHRKVYLPFPLGVREPHQVMDWSNRDLPGLWQFVRSGEKPPIRTRERYADYVVLDMKRPYFMVDRGCGWIYGACQDKAMEQKFFDQIAYARDYYETIFERDGFMILRRLK